MEELKNFVRKEIVFDNQHDLEGRNFERALSEAMDNCLIYYSDCKAFFEIDPVKVIALSKENGYEVNTSEDEIHQITDYARGAFSCLVYNYLYSELEEAYKEAQKLDKGDFMSNDFETNIELLIDNGLDNYYSRGDLIDLIKDELDNSNFLVAKHLLECVEKEEAQHYIYDWSMGVLETPTPLKDNDDLLSYAQDMGLIKEEE